MRWICCAVFLSARERSALKSSTGHNFLLSAAAEPSSKATLRARRAQPITLDQSPRKNLQISAENKRPRREAGGKRAGGGKALACSSCVSQQSGKLGCRPATFGSNFSTDGVKTVEIFCTQSMGKHAKPTGMSVPGAVIH
eukprot:2631034-Rhodomonas_salina.2